MHSILPFKRRGGQIPNKASSTTKRISLSISKIKSSEKCDHA
jgi:hypothetical protein